TGTGLGRIAVQLREFHFQLGHPHAILFCHLWQRIDALLLLLDLPQLFMTHDDGVDGSEVFISELVLAQDADALVSIHADVARGGLELAAEYLHEGGFTGPVGADQAIAVASTEAQGYI